MKNKFLLILVSLASLFFVSCFESKINGLEKYNGNVYVSTTISERYYLPWEDEKIFYYTWMYIENGKVYIERHESNTEKPTFMTGVYDYSTDDYIADGITFDIYFEGSGTTYETPDNGYWKYTLNFSEDGNSVICTYNTYQLTINENENLELVIFKE